LIADVAQLARAADL